MVDLGKELVMLLRGS